MNATKINRTDQGEPIDEHSWPKHTVPSIECRKRDVIVRVADWHRIKEAPYWDVEVYVRGVYDWNESKSCASKAEAVAFASAQLVKFLL